MQQSTVVEIVEEEEVVDAIIRLASQIGRNLITIRDLRKTYGETQKAICSLPLVTAERILNSLK